MSFIRNPGTVIVYDPFRVQERWTSYRTYFGVEEDAGLTVFYRFSSYDYGASDENFVASGRYCFIAESPYPSYRIVEKNILLKPDPSRTFSSGIVWYGGGNGNSHYMYVNYRGELIVSTNISPGSFPAPDDVFPKHPNAPWLTPEDIIGDYWVWSSPRDDYSSVTLRHYLDESKNITLQKEFPRWLRRDHQDARDLPCGYYDPVDGAEGTILIGTPTVDGTSISFDRKASVAPCYMAEVLTWK